jgi:hypothetical protein
LIYRYQHEGYLKIIPAFKKAVFKKHGIKKGPQKKPPEQVSLTHSSG